MVNVQIPVKENIEVELADEHARQFEHDFGEIPFVEDMVDVNIEDLIFDYENESLPEVSEKVDKVSEKVTEEIENAEGDPEGEEFDSSNA
ncbi:hypothetical protein L1987_48837 [Smallanthus sonchifolius]|uniref:Uncharacterized protein n=1 Tax=Smallanthus sonchifolius TaxID=185202 RepID=A0ACB9FU29_9ASTR|nr:hypothetical protein L1987_48837 [Smallanthus sonchifolius]